jgi:hypothetical protein
MIILTDNFNTEFGIIQTSIQTGNTKSLIQNNGLTVNTLGHKITLEIINLQNGLISKKMPIETSIGWRWYIEKVNSKEEKISIECKLLNPTINTEFGASSGEYLDAIEIENKTHHLHIGTEDTDALWERAQNDDWLPKRFENKLGLHRNKVLDFTKYIDFGFKTNIPNLGKGEKIYFHYLVATNKIKMNNYDKETQDISTWFAVEQSKREIDQYLGT